MAAVDRRRFLCALAAADLLQAQPVAVRYRGQSSRRDPLAALIDQIAPGRDEYPLERQALETVSHLRRLVSGGGAPLPLAPSFEGISIYPATYTQVADDVRKAEFDLSDRDFATGLAKWRAALGAVRDARFFVLPDDIVRYEIATAAAYRVGLWRQRWQDGRVTNWAPIEEHVTSAREPLFADITGYAFAGVASFRDQLRLGIPAWRGRLDVTSGIDVHGANGIAAGDIDADGWDELYVCQPGGLPNRLYKNRGDGTFADITAEAGVGILDATASALFVDFRNIGRQDLVVLRPAGPILFLNQGNNRFVRRDDAFAFEHAPEGSFTGMAAADYDRDGRVDLYLCTYAFFRSQGDYRYPVPFYDARNGPPNYLFRNTLAADGAGRFVDVTKSTGLSHHNNRYSFAPAWCDYDGDGWPDVFVANDFGRKNLYRNQGGKFTDVAAEAGVEDLGQGMSASWFDYDGDGRPDLYVSNMWTDAGQRVIAQGKFQSPEMYLRHTKGNSLFRNRGDGTFEDTGAAEGVEVGRWAWSSDGIDFDNDGTPEILVTAGMLTNSHAEANASDLESFQWRKVAAASPDTPRPDVRYEDGWKALTRSAHEEHSLAGSQPNLLYVRRGGRYYDFSGVSGLDFADDSRAFAVTDFDGDGAFDVVLKSRLGPQLRVLENRCAGARQSIVFRLRGVRSNRDAIGARVEVDGKVKLLQAGSGYLSQHTKELHFGLGGETHARRVSLLWPSGLRQEFHNLAAGHRYAFEEGNPDFTQIPFAPRAPKPARPVEPENRPALASTWLLHPVPLPETLTGPGFAQLTEADPLERRALYLVFLRSLFDLRVKSLPLPLWFLVDGQGRAQKVYLSEPDVADLGLMDTNNRLTLALPFAGAYCSPPEVNYASLGAAFLEAGFGPQSLRYFERAPQNDVKTLFAIGQIHLQDGRFAAARTYIEKGLAIAPESAEGWNNLGGAEMGAQHFDEAVKHYEKALALNPRLLSALINGGQAHAEAGRLDQAEQHLRRALEIAPADADAAHQLGRLEARRGRRSEAKALFQRAIEAQHDHADAVNSLGILYTESGQLNDAIAAFQYGIGVAPDHEPFYLNLAGVYVTQKNFAAARQTLRQLLARQPGNTAARRALSEVGP